MRRIQRTYKREKGKGKNQNNISVCIKAFSFRALKQSFEAFSGTEMIWLRLLLKGANTLCCRCLGWSCKPRQMPKLLFTYFHLPLPLCQVQQVSRIERTSQSQRETVAPSSLGFLGKHIPWEASLSSPKAFPQTCRFPGNTNTDLRNPGKAELLLVLAEQAVQLELIFSQVCFHVLVQAQHLKLQHSLSFKFLLKLYSLYVWIYKHTILQLIEYNFNLITSAGTSA